MAMSVRVTTLNGRIVHEVRHGVESFFLRDPQGSTIALAGVDGKITDTYQYWPFGEVLSHVGGSATPFTFLGTLGYFKDFLAMYYVRARHLRADLARWLTVDPFWPDESPYEYGSSAPSLFLDPLGQGVILSIIANYFAPRPGPRKQRPPRYAFWTGAIELARELCSGDILGCKGVNDNLPPCTASNPNFNTCGIEIIGTNPGSGCANKSNWPTPKPQSLGCDFFLGEYCCIECQMRVCCAFG